MTSSVENDCNPFHELIMEYLKTPWIIGGRELGKALDCWGLLMDFYHRVFGISVEDQSAYYATASLLDIGKSMCDWTANLPHEWVSIQRPLPGCMVLMGRNSRIHHVGVYLEIGGKGKILHTEQRIGGKLTPLNSCASEGWRVLKFYTHRANL